MVSARGFSTTSRHTTDAPAALKYFAPARPKFPPAPVTSTTQPLKSDAEAMLVFPWFSRPAKASLRGWRREPQKVSPSQRFFFASRAIIYKYLSCTAPRRSVVLYFIQIPFAGCGFVLEIWTQLPSHRQRNVSRFYGLTMLQETIHPGGSQHCRVRSLSTNAIHHALWLPWRTCGNSGANKLVPQLQSRAMQEVLLPRHVHFVVC